MLQGPRGDLFEIGRVGAQVFADRLAFFLEAAGQAVDRAELVGQRAADAREFGRNLIRCIPQRAHLPFQRLGEIL